jgi:hypothetical protein
MAEVSLPYAATTKKRVEQWDVQGTFVFVQKYCLPPNPPNPPHIFSDISTLIALEDILFLAGAGRFSFLPPMSRAGAAFLVIICRLIVEVWLLKKPSVRCSSLFTPLLLALAES